MQKQKLKTKKQKSKKVLRATVNVSEEFVLLNFIAEAGLLKRVKRSGWWVLGIKDPESVAEHSFRCAIIGYLLAKKEHADAYKVLFMTLFNDIHEARINDLHKVGHRYIRFREAEEKVFEEQMAPLPGMIRSEMKALHKEYVDQNTKESRIARDADILECLIQAKEYMDQGNTEAKKFFQQAPSHLATKSAQQLWRSLTRWHSNDWWVTLGVFER